MLHLVVVPTGMERAEVGDAVDAEHHGLAIQTAPGRYVPNLSFEEAARRVDAFNICPWRTRFDAGDLRPFENWSLLTPQTTPDVPLFESLVQQIGEPNSRERNLLPGSVQ
jgi:hypothetical protein